jgi:hypothetical protein
MEVSHSQDAAPLRLPASAPFAVARLAGNGKLRGHSMSAAWLPEGWFDELDQIRVEHSRVRAQVVAELDALQEL